MSDLITVNLSDLPLTTGPRPSKAFIDSVRSYGILVPIIVANSGDGYQLVAGNRRVAALRACGIKDYHIPAVVVKRSDADLVTVIENQLRTDNFATQTLAITRLYADGMDKAAITSLTGMPRVTIETHLRYANTHGSLFDAFGDGLISATVMDQVSRCTPEEQDQLAVMFSGRGKITSADVKTVQEASRAPLRAEGGSNVVELITETERPYTLPELTADINRIADRAKAQGFSFDTLYQILVASNAYAIHQEEAAF